MLCRADPYGGACHHGCGDFNGFAGGGGSSSMAVRVVMSVLRVREVVIAMMVVIASFQVIAVMI